MIFDSVVVGGGVSGLTAALILARQGRQVALVEKAPRVAPLLRGFTREGTYFDSAFHYAGGLAEGEILDLFFRHLGLRERLETFPFKKQGFDLFRDTDSGWEFQFPAGVSPLRNSLCAAFPKETAAIGDFLRAIDKACRLLPYFVPEIPAEKWDGAAFVRGPSLTEVLDRLTDDFALKQLLSLHTLLHGVPPEEVPFAFHAGVTASYYQSAFGIVGGGQALADAFEAQLASQGVVTYLGRAVRGLSLTAAGTLEGVELVDGERLDCRECLVSTHPGKFLDLVPEKVLRPAFRNRLRNLEDTVSAFILYVESPTATPVLEGANLILGKLDGDGESWRGKLEGRPLFIAAASSGVNKRGPSGWSVICPAQWEEAAEWGRTEGRGREPGYRAQKERVCSELMDRLRRQAPELADQARLLDAATPLTLRDFGGSPAGALYGVKHKVGQYNPQPIVRIPGVFLTGQATAAPGVLGAIISAFLTCGHLFGHDNLRKEVLACR